MAITNKCSVCYNDDLQSIIEFGDIPLCDGYSKEIETAKGTPKFNITVVHCSKCNHAELDLKPPESMIYSNYNYFSSNSPDLDEHFISYANWINAKLGTANAVHLDVGCNDGLLLDKSAKLGFSTVGIDPAPAGSIAKEKGHDFYSGYFNTDIVTENKLEASADILTCNNILANVRDLTGYAKAANLILKNDGFFVAETLHFPTLMKNLVFEMVNHEHYHYFSTRSMMKLYNSAGFELISCELVPTKGGNMRCMGRKRNLDGSPFTQSYDSVQVDPKLAETESNEKAPAFNSAFENAREKLLTIVKDGDKKVEVAGFGAVAGSIILSYLMGIEDNVDYFVDDNTSRHGFYSPGIGSQVISPADYYERKPDVTILLAWRFAKQITDKHRKNMPAHHKFIMANTGEEY
ncbi:MAG: 2-polyprenyl-3-methyl-5-hydroxy-6-metoxy-1,4-benzoquinol methylase [Bacteriovoracaceae bacterium]